MVTLRRRSSVPEEIDAAERSVLGLTAGVGAMATLISLMVGDPLAVVGVPSLATFVLVARGETIPGAWAAMVAWLVFATRAPNEAIVVPLALSGNDPFLGINAGLIGLVANVGGGLIHLLLVLALIVIVVNLLSGRRAV